jgi:hypothetical protein
MGDGIQVYSMYDVSVEMTGNYLVAAKITEKLALIKEEAQNLTWRNLISRN